MTEKSAEIGRNSGGSVGRGAVDVRKGGKRSGTLSNSDAGLEIRVGAALERFEKRKKIETEIRTKVVSHRVGCSILSKQKKSSRCWQLRSVAKFTSQCCPARRWPRAYHVACSANRIRGKPWKCSTRRSTPREANSPSDGASIRDPKTRRTTIRRNITTSTSNRRKNGAIRIPGRPVFTVSRFLFSPFFPSLFLILIFFLRVHDYTRLPNLFCNFINRKKPLITNFPISEKRSLRKERSISSNRIDAIRSIEFYSFETMV